MIMNLLFTALCLGLVLLVNLDANASRRMQRVRVPRDGAGSRPSVRHD